MKRRNRKLRKALLTTCCALALVAISVGATLAYLTDTEAVTNVFTVGDVGLSLDEAKVDEMGKPIEDADRVTENKYKLIPGHIYTKDPTVTMDAGSEDSYVRMLVTVSKYSHLKAALETAGLNDYVDSTGLVLLEKMVGGWDANKWAVEKAYAGSNADTMVYEFRHVGIVEGSETEKKLDALFTEFTLPGEIKNMPDGSAATTGYIEQLDGMEINVVAHAMQAAGFENNEDGAWDAFDKQMN